MSVAVSRGQRSIGYKPLQQIAYERLRQSIINGKYRPGARINISAVARDLGISPIPVRESLRSLEAEGLVSLVPNRGAVVRELSIDELEEIFWIRLPLETLALRRGIRRLTKDDLRRLGNLLEEMKGQHVSASQWMSLNERFHMLVYQRAESPRLLQLIVGMWTEVRPYLSVYVGRAGSLRQASSEHVDLLRSLRAGDVAAAVRILDEHLSNTRDVVVKALKDSVVGAVG